MSVVYKKLKDFLQLPAEEDEAVNDYSLRLAKAANSLSDDGWHALGGSEEGREAQRWVNKVLEAHELGGALPKLEGYKPGKGDRREPRQPKAKAKAARKASRPKKVAKKAAKKGTGKRGRRGSYEADAVIALLVKENPCAKGSKVAGRFDKYRNGMTVQEALDAGLTWGDFRRDTKKKHIALKPAK